jgi:hypothetical protein
MSFLELVSAIMSTTKKTTTAISKRKLALSDIDEAPGSPPPAPAPAAAAAAAAAADEVETKSKYFPSAAAETKRPRKKAKDGVPEEAAAAADAMEDDDEKDETVSLQKKKKEAAAAASSAADITDDNPADPDFHPGDSLDDPDDEVLVDVEEEEEEEEEPADDEGCVKLFKAKKTAKALTIPTDPDDFINPNATMAYYSAKHGLNVHYTEINPEKHFQISETLPDDKKKIPNAKAFHRVICTKSQKWDKMGGTDFKKPRFKEAMVIGPFGLANFPAMYPHGDRFARPMSSIPAPTDVGKIKFKLPITNEEYHPALSDNKKKVGMVDRDQDKFQSSWIRSKMEPWLAEASWGVSNKAFPIARAKLEADITGKFSMLDNKHGEALDKFMSAPKKTRGAAPVPPDTSDAKKEELLRADFIDGAFKSAVLSSLTGKTPFTHTTFSNNVLVGLTSKERNDASFVPDIPEGDQWLMDMFKNPPLWENPKNKEKSPGFAKRPYDLPMYVCATPQMAQDILDKKAPFTPSCMRLVKRENRFIDDNDVVAPILQWTDKYDSPMGSGWYWKLVGVLWLGEQSKMGPIPDAVPGADPTSYFRLAQPYTRTKANFTPKSAAGAAAAGVASADGSSVSFAPNDPDHAGFAS